MELYHEFFKLIERLNGEGVDYAVVGGIALAFHDVPRFTKDIDILVRAEDLTRLEHVLERLGYRKHTEPWTFKNTNMTLHRFIKPGEDEDLLVVDLLIGNEPEHEKIIERAVSDDSNAGNVRLASRQDLIELKRIRNSAQDKVDIENLQNEQDRKGG